MKLEEEKLFLTEEEFKCLKQAAMFPHPLYAGLWLRNSLKNKNLEEDPEHKVHTTNFYAKCVIAYRKKNFEII